MTAQPDTHTIDASTYVITTVVKTTTKSIVPVIEAVSALDGGTYHFTVNQTTPIVAQHLAAAQSVLQAEPTKSMHLILGSARLPVFRSGVDAWAHFVGTLSS